eukprot:CAMPEP_0184521666 /NCGR_PEP_ID=MMETSP0198_2-20121128/7823_1 /TAXON_ID=1112570 /ORGANISM="Thraustochytrium sp., Strain LLF1b" /LENGTH=176 /DNA_ID=CAMNT_0026912347 /DNA_START=228 /DNA_END=758 /DNA_ORIENTATION=-
MKRELEADEALPSVEELEEKYGGLKVPELKAWLSINKMTKSGAKKELIAKCIEGERLGVPPMCPLCKRARTKTKNTTEFYCPGYYDSNEGGMVKCDFTGTMLTRIPWVDLNGKPLRLTKMESEDASSGPSEKKEPELAVSGAKDVSQPGDTIQVPRTDTKLKKKIKKRRHGFKKVA